MVPPVHFSGGLAVMVIDGLRRGGFASLACAVIALPVAPLGRASGTAGMPQELNRS